MALSNLFGWTKKMENTAAAACGAECPGDIRFAPTGAERRTACGAGDKQEQKPAACGSACGAGDEPTEKPAACGAECPGDIRFAPTEAERRSACGAGDK